MERARPATGADIPALTRLTEMAVAELDGQRGGKLLIGSLLGGGPLRERLARAIGDPNRLLAVGTTDNVEVGFASARCDRIQDRTIGVIEAIYVEPPARQVGVGEVLVEMVLAWCAARGCSGVDAPALPGSRAAKAFFEDNGFVSRLLVMHRALPEPGG